MNLDGDTNTDEYFVTASQIFDYCGAESTGTLRVNVLMNKFAPIVKTNKAEFGAKIAELKLLLDPDQCNPEITISTLAMTLNKYSESQKIKVDLEESFSLKNEQVPHDSDSGISTDGFQLLEELQCELREKSHLAHQLRSQLDFADRQHEEALAALSMERDTLRAHLNMLREESMTLTHVRRDYEEVCERLCGCEHALEDARRELDAARKSGKTLQGELAALDAEKSTLQEQLSRSTAECHRINEMYASRQAALLQENEALRAERAELAARLHDHDQFVQQVVKEKVVLEMELKDMLNKSNHGLVRGAERSIDVSYTEDQMLTELDSLNVDSRFIQEHHLLDEESFVNALREDQGRSTNISLFHELRLSLCNMSRHNSPEHSVPEILTDLDTSLTTATQTEEGYNEKELNAASDKVEIRNITQSFHFANQSVGTQFDFFDIASTAYTQTDAIDKDFVNNNSVQSCIDCFKCTECERLKSYTSKLETDIRHSRKSLSDMTLELGIYEDNLNALKIFVSEGNNRNNVMEDRIESLKSEIIALESVCKKQGDTIQKITCCETNSVVVQTESEQFSVSTQAELPCTDCVSRRAAANRKWKHLLWEPLRWLFQLFAVICFACAVCVLYAVTTRARAVCRDAPAVPWRWLHAQDLLDLLLRIEYVADVPM